MEKFLQNCGEKLENFFCIHKAGPYEISQIRWLLIRFSRWLKSFARYGGKLTRCSRPRYENHEEYLAVKRMRERRNKKK